MKKTLFLYIAAAALMACTASAQISYVDILTRVTNGTSSTGSRITITNVCTNAVYTITNPASVTIGDELPAAFAKVNTNFWWQYNFMLSLSNRWAATNVDIYGKLSAQQSWVNWSSNAVKNFSGTNVIDSTINSNKFDADTMTWLGSLGSGGGGGGSMSFDSGAITSDGSGNLTATTVKSGLTDSGYSTGTYGYTAVAMGDGTWTWMAGVTITNIITNTITAYAFSNQFLSSALLTTFSTNNITWGTSNFLARVNGLFSYTLNGGMLGGGGLAPGTNVDIRLTGSYSGTNAWFVVTNGFKTTNTISIAATGAGGGLGNAALYVLDHPELEGRTNSFFGQYVRFSSPVDPSDAATKSYVDTAVANVKDGGFSSYSSNGLSHFVWSYQNRIVFDITSATTWIPLKGSSVDGSYTHILVDVYQTNLTSGYDFQSSTNLALTAGFTTLTNYTLSTNTGVVTFSVPIATTEPQRFFRIISSIASGAAFNVPLTLNGGTIYPSNTWSLTTITSSIPNFGWWVGTSNGQALVSVGVSNGTVRIKQLAP
jgi:hypothetical protein